MLPEGSTVMKHWLVSERSIHCTYFEAAPCIGMRRCLLDSNAPGVRLSLDRPYTIPVDAVFEE